MLWGTRHANTISITYAVLIFLMLTAEAPAGSVEDYNAALRLSKTGDYQGSINLYNRAIQLPKGLYRVIRQREFDAGMSRLVAD